MRVNKAWGVVNSADISLWLMLLLLLGRGSRRGGVDLGWLVLAIHALNINPIHVAHGQHNWKRGVLDPVELCRVWKSRSGRLIVSW